MERPEFTQKGHRSRAETVDREVRARHREELRAARDAAREQERALRTSVRERKRAERSERRRFTAHRRRRMWQTLAALGVVAAMVGVLALLVTTPAMAVREIRIEGADRVSESEIRGALHDIEGTPIALVRPDEVRERLAQFSALQTVAVDLAPPSTMIVRVHERIPVARTADGELVDAAGVRMGAPREGEDSLPVLVDIELGSPEFEAVAHVLRNLAPDLLARTEQVSAASDSDIELVLHGGQRIVWGSRDETALKSAAALVLLDHEVSEGRVIDVTAPGHPVVR